MPNPATAGVVLVVTFRPREGSREDLAAALRHMCAESRQEPGCLAYDLFEVADGSLCLIEHYRDAQALEDHRTTAHMTFFRETVPGLLQEKWTILRLAPRDVAG
jgi:quinol monooxygenase YgiN